MKQPIAMRCTKEQFEEIKPKLKNCEVHKMSGFDIDNYLVNNGFGKENIIINLSIYSAQMNGRLILEEWNEKIFLEACGIEVEKTFSITESQIKEVNDFFLMHKSKESSDKWKEWFPDAFESEVKLQVGKWYKYPDYQKWNFHITEIDVKAKKAKGYGFGTDGLWMETALNDSWDFEELELCIEMSEQEIFEVLKNEAVKRGFKEGVFVKGMDEGTCILKGEFEIIQENVKSRFKGVTCCGFTDNDGSDVDIFRNGIWAEIIPTITKEEAEKLLNKKIV